MIWTDRRRKKGTKEGRKEWKDIKVREIRRVTDRSLPIHRKRQRKYRRKESHENIGWSSLLSFLPSPPTIAFEKKGVEEGERKTREKREMSAMRKNSQGRGKISP